MILYGKEEIMSAFQRMTVAGAESYMDKPAPFTVEELKTATEDPQFPVACMAAAGIDLVAAIHFCSEVVPSMVEVTMLSLAVEKQAPVFALDNDDIGSICATALLRGMALGVLLTMPEAGDNSETIDRLQNMTMSRDELIRIAEDQRP